MRFLIITLAALNLVSCNTLIGIGRDTKQGYQWTKAKIENQGGGSSDSYGDANAPVY